MFIFPILSACLFSNLPPIKNEEAYRVFDSTSPQKVHAFYQENHAKQTLQFVLDKENQYTPPRQGKMGIWDAIRLLDALVDESDPDLDLPQRYHLFQTAEALRKDGHPRWLILTGFIHDLGKILMVFGEPQWAVVGDTFPVGCSYSEKNVFPEYFQNNPDMQIPLYQTKYGIYSEGCGFDNLHISWGHDEYLYQVVKNYLPPEGAYIIRYHSFYPAHLHDAYSYFMNEKDRQMLPWLKLFRKYDLYSKSSERIDINALMPYYEDLVAEFFPPTIDW